MKISVVTPSYNQGRYLERTLRSVLQQRYADLEYIVVDGHSEDESAGILSRYADQIDCLIVEPDSGQAEALAKGFANATGEVLAFLNSDDILMPNTLEFVAQFFAAHPGVDAIYSHRIDIDETDDVTGFWILPPHNSYCMSRWDYIPQETCFWRRSLMTSAGPINDSLNFALDYDLFVRMMKLGNFARVNRFLAAFRRHATSKSSTVYETVGRQEVATVRSMNEIRIHWYDEVLKYFFAGSILATSFAFKLLAGRFFRGRANL